jgi:hypothetical protein
MDVLFFDPLTFLSSSPKSDDVHLGFSPMRNSASAPVLGSSSLRRKLGDFE